MSAVIELPALRVADGPSVSLQPAEVAGTRLFIVTVHNRDGRRRDRWFGDEADALAHAAEHADLLGLLLLDLRDGAEG